MDSHFAFFLGETSKLPKVEEAAEVPTINTESQDPAPTSAAPTEPAADSTVIQVTANEYDATPYDEDDEDNYSHGDHEYDIEENFPDDRSGGNDHSNHEHLIPYDDGDDFSSCFSSSSMSAPPPPPLSERGTLFGFLPCLSAPIIKQQQQQRIAAQKAASETGEPPPPPTATRTAAEVSGAIENKPNAALVEVSGDQKKLVESEQQQQHSNTEDFSIKAALTASRLAGDRYEVEKKIAEADVDFASFLLQKTSTEQARNEISNDDKIRKSITDVEAVNKYKPRTV